MSTASAIGASSIGALPPRKWSIALWADVAAFSVVFSYALTFVLGLFFVGLGALLTLGMLSQGLSFFGVMLDCFSFIVGFTILWSLVPRKDVFDPQGVLIDMSREHRLRSELEAIAQAMGESIPAEVYLISEANAAVAQRGGIMGFGSRRVMLLGLPLLQALNVSQFRAILAHEFAHFYARDTRLGPWVFRARTNMARVVNGLAEESIVLSFLNRWAIIQLLYLIVVGGLVLYWKLFTRVTQYVSRRQEFRCDELACHIAGSDSMEGGLRNINRAATTFEPYWRQVVMPVAALGYCPEVADGFARFMSAPEVANAAAALLEKRLATKSSNPLDSHPPLPLRLQRVRALAIPAPGDTKDSDAVPAIQLLNDLASLELKLLQKLVPGLKTSELKAMRWDSAASDVYIPLWRQRAALIQPVLAGRTVGSLPEIFKALPELASRIPDPPGTLLTREQRAGRAAEALSFTLTLALVDGGWHLQFQPGQFHVERDGQKLEPGTLIANLRNGKLTARTWLELCAKHNMTDWPLLADGAVNITSNPATEPASKAATG